MRSQGLAQQLDRGVLAGVELSDTSRDDGPLRAHMEPAEQASHSEGAPADDSLHADTSTRYKWWLVGTGVVVLLISTVTFYALTISHDRKAYVPSQAVPPRVHRLAFGSCTQRETGPNPTWEQVRGTSLRLP
jgi:hypothetical protein